MKWKLVIFDLDGTLLDTVRDLGEAVNYSLARKGFPIHDLDEYPSMVGNGIRNLVKSALPAEFQQDKELIRSRTRTFLSYYYKHIDKYTEPYSGMHALLRNLVDAGVKVAVASNKVESGAQELVSKFFPDINFVAVLGDAGRPLKPDPDMIIRIMDMAGVGKESAVFVGDSPSDVKTAQNAGIAGIAVSWGYRPAEQLGGASAIVSNPDRLYEILKEGISG